MDTEEWRDVPQHEGIYQVSNFGRFKSLPRVLKHPTGAPYRLKGRILKQQKNSNGYWKIDLRLGNKKKTSSAHRIVAEAFLWCENFNDLDVNHVDGNKLNNRVDNLEMCTRSENIKHAYRAGLRKRMGGSRSPSASIDDMQVLTIKTLLTTGMQSRTISKMYNICEQVIGRIKRKESWSHI